MTRPLAMQGGKPGRKTNAEIVDDYLQGLNLEPEVVAAIRDADPRVQVVPSGAPGSFTEMYERASAALWTDFQNSKGIAKVQQYREIALLAKKEAESGGDAEPDPLLADVIAGVASLSPIRRRHILVENRVRYADELAAIDDVLARMDAEPVAA